MLTFSKLFFSVSFKKIEEAKQRIQTNPEPTTEQEASVLEKLLKIDPKLAAVMAMDMLSAGIDTVTNLFPIIT